VKIPNGCTRIGQGAFLGTAIKQVVVPNDCEIGISAFHNCRSLRTVTVGTGRSKSICPSHEDRGVRGRIAGYAFSGCTALISVTLSSTLQSIGGYAFEGCPALATIANPKGCRVHKDAFYGDSTCVTEL
jgi:hypothetical protein